jgi:cytochrome c-type biogenesis protein CcmH
MTSFWIISALMVVAALAFLAPPLIRGPGQDRRQLGQMASQAQKQLRSLEQAHRDGHLKESDYQSRRDELSEVVMQQIGGEVETDPATRSPITAIVLVLIAPIFAVSIYQQIGDPVAIKASEQGWLSSSPSNQNHQGAAPGEAGEDSQAPDLSQAVRGLEARLAENPEDVDGWFLLGHSYMTTQAFEQARDAYAQALALAPEEPAIMVEYAQAIAFAAGQPKLPEQAEELLRKALSLDPLSQKGLWMLGLNEFHNGRGQAALDLWQSLLNQLEPNSEVAHTLTSQMDEARELVSSQTLEAFTQVAVPAQETAMPADHPPVESQAPAPTNDPVDPVESQAPAPADGLVAVNVEVSLDAELASRVNASDTVYIFARAASGPPMPLAIQRVAVGQLPITVRLDETMAMMPAMSMASFPEVIIGARVSKSGDAAPQPGDFQALSDPIQPASTASVRLNIDTVL